MRKCLCGVSTVRKRLIGAAKAQATSKRMKLISNPTRLQILSILAGGDTCVCVLSRVLGRRQPNISQHLCKLRQAGIIESYSLGKLVFYRLKDIGVKRFMKQC